VICINVGSNAKRMTKNQIWTSTISAAFIGLAIYYSLMVNKYYGEIRERGIELTGEITVFGSDIFVNCNNPNGITNKRMSKPYATIYDGEKFKVYFLEKYPDRFYVDFKQPIYNKTVYRRTDCLEIKDTGDYLRFKYKVKGEEFERFCESDIVVANYTLDKLKIDYNVEDPRISYLLVE
jgi:hypothetical protein